MNLINGIARWLLVSLVLFFGLLIICLAYFVSMFKIIRQHKGQAGRNVPDSPACSEPATLPVGACQPVKSVSGVQYDAAFTRWLQVERNDEHGTRRN